jgi:hypothetical protein
LTSVVVRVIGVEVLAQEPEMHSQVVGVVTRTLRNRVRRLFD